MTDKIDREIELSRVSHELMERHGLRAHLHAAKLAEAALKEGDREAHDFWRAVEASVVPRGQTP